MQSDVGGQRIGQPPAQRGGVEQHGARCVEPCRKVAGAQACSQGAAVQQLVRGTQGAQLIHMVLQRALGGERYSAVVLAGAAPLAVDAVLRHPQLQVVHARCEQGLVVRGLAQFFERAANVVRHINGKARVAA